MHLIATHAAVPALAFGAGIHALHGGEVRVAVSRSAVSLPRRIAAGPDDEPQLPAEFVPTRADVPRLKTNQTLRRAAGTCPLRPSRAPRP